MRIILIALLCWNTITYSAAQAATTPNDALAQTPLTPIAGRVDTSSFGNAFNTGVLKQTPLTPINGEVIQPITDPLAQIPLADPTGEIAKSRTNNPLAQVSLDDAYAETAKLMQENPEAFAEVIKPEHWDEALVRVAKEAVMGVPMTAVGSAARPEAASTSETGSSLPSDDTAQATDRSKEFSPIIKYCLLSLIGLALFYFMRQGGDKKQAAKSDIQKKATIPDDKTKCESCGFVLVFKDPVEEAKRICTNCGMVVGEEQPLPLPEPPLTHTPPLLVSCHRCGHNFSKRASACPKCGATGLAECHICKKQIPEISVSCPECGDPTPFGQPTEKFKEITIRETENGSSFGMNKFIWLAIIFIAFVIKGATSGFAHAFGYLITLFIISLVFSIIWWGITKKKRSVTPWKWFDWLNAGTYIMIGLQILYMVVHNFMQAKF